MASAVEKEVWNLSIYDIIEYLGTSKRPLVEGERICDSNHIVICGKISDKSDEKKEINIRSLCLRTTALHDHPYEIKIKLSKTLLYDHDRMENKLKIEGECQCVAGLSGKCKHLTATLLYVYRVKIHNLENLSCTDVSQAWGKYKKDYDEKYKPIPIKEMCHFQETKSSIDVQKYMKNSPLSQDEIRKKFIELLPDCELALHSKGRHNKVGTEMVGDDVDDGITHEQQVPVDEALAAFIESRLNRPISLQAIAKVNCNDPREDLFYNKYVAITKEKAFQLCLNTTNQSENEEWKRSRSCRITASFCYDVYTYTKSNRDTKDWGKKTTDWFASSFLGNSDTALGKREEPSARKQFEDDYGREVKQLGLFVHPDAPWLGVSADGVTDDNHLLEIKTSTFKLPLIEILLSRKLKYLAVSQDENGNVQVALKKRHRYYGQIILGMGLLNLPSAYFMVYNSFDKKDVVLEIPFDEKFFHEMTTFLKIAYFDEILPILASKLIKSDEK